MVEGVRGYVKEHSLKGCEHPEPPSLPLFWAQNWPCPLHAIACRADSASLGTIFSSALSPDSHGTNDLNDMK